MHLLSSTWLQVAVTRATVKESKKAIQKQHRLTNSSLLNTTKISQESRSMCLRFLDSKCLRAPTMRAHLLNLFSKCKLRLREPPALMVQEIAMAVEKKPAIPRKW